jgi:hypothetical protein
MTDLKHEQDNMLVFDAADETVVFYAIAPETGQVAPQRLAESSWVFGSYYAFTKITQDALLSLAVEFSKLTAGSIVKFDFPRRVSKLARLRFTL